MAIAFSMLASGSSGNSIWVRGGGVEILVDCGLSARAISRRIADAGGDLRDVEAVVCTHAHTDHVAGAAVLARRHDLDIYATRATLERIPNRPPEERMRELPVSGTTRIGGLSIHSLPTQHDAPDSVALVISDGDTHLGIATDLGVPTAELVKALARVDGLVLEANHDVDMLANGDYPAFLKRRISSRVGHLSNDQTAALLRQVMHPGLQHLTLAHLSEHNNAPDVARQAAESVLVEGNLTIDVARQHLVSAPVELVANVATNSGQSTLEVCTPQVAGDAKATAQMRLSYWKP
jgi:phosphoribosyl 1,2-cyclic phosphodiesterase